MRRRWFWGSFALFTLLGAVWVVATPMIGQPDESSHAQRAAATGRGELTWSEQFTEHTHDPEHIITLTRVQVPRAYAELDQRVPWFFFNPRVGSAEAPPVSTETDLVSSDIYTGSYPPAPYLLVGWLGRVLPPSRALYAMRLVEMLAAAALLATGLVAAREADRSGLVVVGAVAGLTPTLLWLTAGIGGAGIELAAGWALWPSLLVVLAPPGPGPASHPVEPHSVEPRSVARLTVVAGALVLARPLSPVYLAVIVGVVALAVARRPRLVELWRSGAARIGLIVMAILVALASAWEVFAQPIGAVMGKPEPGLGFAEAAGQSIGRFPTRMAQMIGVLGWLDTPLPRAVLIGWVAAVLLLVAAALWYGTRREGVVLALLLVGVVVAPIVAEAAQAARIGLGWQGRYILPVACGLPILASWIVSRSRAGRARLSRPIRIAAIVAFVSVDVLAVGVALTRWNTGAVWPLDLPTGPLPWATWAPTAGVISAAVVGYALFAGWCVAMVTTPEPDGPTLSRPTASGPATSNETEPDGP